GVFSGGDVVTGAATAIEAIAAGRKAAYAIDSYIQTGKAKPEPVPFHSRRDVYRQVTVDDLREGSREHRRPMPALPVEERTRGFVEVETGYTTDDLRQESYRCLECGCLSLFDCSLRKYATEYGVEIQNYLGEAKEYRVDRSHPLIELDPNKCILCGRCVRICSEVVGVSAFGFIHRGFSTVVRPELGGRLLDTECVTCGLCIGTCPTGAIVEKIPLAKPGPWETRSVPSICHYCGTGCRIQYDVFGDSLIKVSRQEDHPVTHGNHCRKGRFGYGHVQAADRLVKARIRTGRELEEVSVEDGIAYAGLRLKEFVRRFSGSEIAVFLSPRLTNEEAYLAQKFARVALRTHHVASLANLVNPELFAPDVVSTAGYPEVVDAQAILVVASALDSEHFVVDLFTKKAIRKGARMIYVGPEENRASAYAEVFLQCRPGTEARLMLALEKEFLAITGQEIEDDASLRDAVAATSAEDTEAMTGVPAARVREAAEILAKSILKVCIFNKDFRGPRTPGDARVIRDVARSLGCGLLAMHEKSNMQGILDMGAHPGWLPGYVPVGDAAGVEALEKEWCVRLQDLDPNGADIAALLREKKIRLAILLGEDPFGDESFPPDLRNGLMAADFLIVADVFETMTARLANIVLPLSTTAETSGSFTNQERRVQRVNRAVPPRSGIETWQMICRIAAEMGYRFKMKYANVSEVTEEIRRTVAIYRDVAIAGDPGDRSSSRTGGTADGDSIWDLDAFRLRGPDAAYDQLHEIVEPNETLFLDHVEMRFARWFDAIFEDARKRDEAQEVLQAAQGIQV
ncbi:MAG: molybdopterin-dependent oxidoreductase, partial [Candidatus Eisenbacteria bacterium]|nr:molybdopterin-dependent oxidoreductase [Candidatus Eisenbacteria bacterium]